MSFDYDKVKRKEMGAGGDHWTSNSDLFMVLAFVFLLLYVVSSVRSGANSIHKAISVQELKNQNEDLQRQLRAYNTIKNDYLSNDASEKEMKMYQDLMANLELLQSDSERKRKELERRAQKNADDQEALNQYQQMVRNIINTNLLAKKQIKHRDQMIVDKKEIITDQKNTIADLDQTVQTQTKDIATKAQQISVAQQKIAEQNQEIQNSQAEIDSLEFDLKDKRSLIAVNEAKINELNSDLEDKIETLKKEAVAKKQTEAQMLREVLKLRLDNQKQVAALSEEKDQMTGKLSELQDQIADASDRLSQANESIQEKERERNRLKQEYDTASANYQNQIKDMQGDFEQKIRTQRAQLENQLNQEKASASEKAKRLKEFQQQAAAERENLQKTLGELEGKVADTQKALGDMEQKANEYQDKLNKAKEEHGRYLASLDELKQQNEGLSSDLGHYKEMVEAKQKLAKNIADKLKGKGIKADVDQKSGEVSIDFGDEYFDTGSADLKEQMKTVLEKFVPEYSSALLSDKKIASKIKNVEIIGFSSPTYRGKYVDPNSLKAEDRAALNYNLDLSFQRARSIFAYMTDTSKMTFSQQKEMTPLLKVTGRSYLADGVKGRDLASGLSMKEYCEKFDCKKSQKVIIRFNLND